MSQRSPGDYLIRPARLTQPAQSEKLAFPGGRRIRRLALKDSPTHSALA